jgi:hypothetical protein
MVCSALKRKAPFAKEKSYNEETGICQPGDILVCNMPEKCLIAMGEYCNEETGTSDPGM